MVKGFQELAIQKKQKVPDNPFLSLIQTCNGFDDSKSA